MRHSGRMSCFAGESQMSSFFAKRTSTWGSSHDVTGQSQMSSFCKRRGKKSERTWHHKLEKNLKILSSFLRNVTSQKGCFLNSLPLRKHRHVVDGHFRAGMQQEMFKSETKRQWHPRRFEKKSFCWNDVWICVHVTPTRRRTRLNEEILPEVTLL